MSNQAVRFFCNSRQISCSGGTLFPNKFWEVEAGLWPLRSKLYDGAEFVLFQRNDVFVWRSCLQLFGLFEVSFDWSRRRDHAGVRFTLTILWFSFDIVFYDCRHWDEENDDWCVAPDA